MSDFPVIGMSPGNSYFKDEVVKELLKKVVETYGRAAVFVADVPAISTYVALGYPENRARRDKAIPQGNALKNRTRKAMAELGYTDAQVRIIDWDKDVKDDPRYLVEYQAVAELYKKNGAFKAAAQDATRGVLEHSKKSEVEVSGAVEIAVDYLLSELAFMECAARLLGSDRATYVYHKTWPVYESYIHGEFDGKRRPHMGSAVVMTGSASVPRR